MFGIEYLNFGISFGFLGIYLIYVAIVVIQAKYSKKTDEEALEDAQLNLDAAAFVKAASVYKRKNT